IRQLVEQIENNFPPGLKNEDWSVDFMYASRGKSRVYRWFLIDMALADVSFHVGHSSDLVWSAPGGDGKEGSGH
ncbi:MAG: hypothetical protein ACP5NO_08445, partial [Thermoplasmata archaeon]